MPGRSLLFVRNVGHLMTTPAVLLADGSEAPEGILDAIMTSLIGLYDLRGLGKLRNSRAGSIYIVKPKMHGPEECGFTDRLFDAVEDLLGLARHTIKVGVMDEERRTSANLAACIHAVKDRIAFINTGFLDRTGDEIHTAMRGGPVIPKAEMKSSAWIKAYEDRNVRIGLACGLSGKAQIGKGMWAAPDRMADMLAQKIAHPMSGANTAWVPSPTAATLHALHYHQVDVFARQKEIAGEAAPGLDALLTRAAGARKRNWSREEVRARAGQQCAGHPRLCRAVDRSGDRLLEGARYRRCRADGGSRDACGFRRSISPTGCCTAWRRTDEVEAAFARMAAKVDAQNAGDPAYRPMAGDRGGLAFQAARALVFEGVDQPNGYTEPLLHRFRAMAKARS